MELPVVSVIMPAFNADATIAESIQSVLDQSFQRWELIVVNDGSLDDTAKIVNSFSARESRIILLTLPRNGGLPNARNKGIDLAKGQFIAFLDSDDLWDKNKLSVQVKFHLDNPEIKISSTNFQSFNSKGIVSRPLKFLIDPDRYKRGRIYPRICYRNSIGVLTVMAKKSLVQEVGLFDSSLWTMEDQDLWIRIARRGVTFGYIPQVLAHYRLTDGGITRRIGKYKRAFKKHIKKILSTETLDGRLIWRNYYRTIGTLYSGKGQFQLARLYFWKSIRLVPFDFLAITTHLYLLYGIYRQGLTYFGSRAQSRRS